MISILRSPRNRRRLAYAVATPLAFAAVVTAAAIWMPEASEDAPEVFAKQEAVNIAAQEKTVRLTRADRKLVNEAIDVLMNDGVKRENPAAVYDVVSPASGARRRGRSGSGATSRSIPTRRSARSSTGGRSTTPSRTI